MGLQGQPVGDAAAQGGDPERLVAIGEIRHRIVIAGKAQLRAEFDDAGPEQRGCREKGQPRADFAPCCVARHDFRLPRTIEPGDILEAVGAYRQIPRIGFDVVDVDIQRCRCRGGAVNRGDRGCHNIGADAVIACALQAKQADRPRPRCAHRNHITGLKSRCEIDIRVAESRIEPGRFRGIGERLADKAGFPEGSDGGEKPPVEIERAIAQHIRPATRITRGVAEIIHQQSEIGRTGLFKCDIAAPVQNGR